MESPGKQIEFHTAIFAWSVVNRTALPCSGCYHLERSGMNCKNGATTENQGLGVKYMGNGVYVE